MLANQVAFAPFYRMDNGRRFSIDAWDGYPLERQSVLDFLASNELRNTVAITGDAHVSSVRNVPESYLRRDGATIATEFIGTSISSDGNPPTRRTRLRDDALNPQFIWQNNERGYVRVSVEPGSWTTEFRRQFDAHQTGVAATPIARFVVEHGNPGAIGPESVVSPV